ncbi:MAG: DUF2225 domain-containing protein, partial [Treponema sp.]|nr:DUF2225 domain-containing protein [Treponema sp.]
MSVEERELKVSFFSKKEYTCPVCGEIFRKEELLSGGGRLIAGPMTSELHRLYEPSLKYGEVYPLIYQATVCPECWYTAMDADFSLLPEKSRPRVQEDRKKRKAGVALVFPDIDFRQPRGLAEGAASQYLTLCCYEYFDKDFSPTIKQGLAS